MKAEEYVIDPLIHAPARFQILSNLYLTDWVDFLFLQNITNLTKGNLSSHLSKLEKVEYVIIKKDFVNKMPKTTISMSEKGLNAFNDYRKNLKTMLNQIPD